MTFTGSDLRRLRHAAGLSQSALARVCGARSYHAIAQMESAPLNGLRAERPDAQAVRAVAQWMRARDPRSVTDHDRVLGLTVVEERLLSVA